MTWLYREKGMMDVYGCLIDIDARSVRLDHDYWDLRRSSGGRRQMEKAGNAYDRIQDIATAHGFRKFKGCLYLSEEATREDAIALIDDIIEKCPWFPRAATQAHILEFTSHENMIDRVRDHLK